MNDHHIQGNLTAALNDISDSQPAQGQSPTLNYVEEPLQFDPLDGRDLEETLHFIRQVRVVTLKSIPRSCRILATQIFTSAVSNILTAPNNVSSWVTLMMLPKVLFRLAPVQQGPRTTKKWARNDFQARYTLARLKKWNSGNDGKLSLWRELLTYIVPGQSSKTKKKSQEELNARRCKELAMEGRLSDALKTLLSSGVAEITQEVLNEIRDKHPFAPPPPVSLDPLPPSVTVQVEDLMDAIKSFTKGSAGGRDGFKPQYYLDFMACRLPSAGQDFLKTFASFHTLCLSGLIPRILAPFIASAPSTPLLKPDNSIRPIAVGEAHRRTTSKLGMKYVRDKMSAYLSPLQVGVGVPNGAEAVVHALNYLLSQPWDSNQFVMKIDLSNAFQNVLREPFLKEVKEHCPEIYPWVEYCYQCPSFLYVGEEILLNHCGVQQGDPLAPLLFALALHIILKKVQEKCPELKLNVWFLDDGTLVGSKQDLLKVLKIFTKDGPALGLYVNLAKSLAWSPLVIADFSGFPVDILTQAGGGTKLLGSAIGDDAALEAVATKRVDKIGAMVDKLDTLNDVQLQYLLLKFCVGMPRFNFQLRTTPFDKIPISIAKFDDVMHDATRSLFGNCPLSDDDLLRISFPISQSGFGLSLAKDTALPAHLASLFDSVALQSQLLSVGPTPVDEHTLVQSFSPLLDSFNQFLPEQQKITSDKILATPKPQHFLSSLKVKYQVDEFIASRSSARERHVVEACRKDSGTWLLVFPLPHLGMSMSAQEWRCAAWFRLGKQLYSAPSNCPVCKDAVLDVYGIHATYCQGYGDATARHNAVRNTLWNICKDAKLSVSDSEPGFLLSNDRSGDRPADLYLRNWERGKNLCVDVCIANSLEYTTVTSRPFDPMEPLNNKENLKNSKYKARCLERGLMFQPFVCGSLGGFNEDAIKFIKVLGIALGNVQGLHRSITIDRIRKWVLFSIQKAQATSWIRRGELGEVMLY
jgi:hypothetical protein